MEAYTRGCRFAHFPPGVLTRFGHTLRAPVGRIHCEKTGEDLEGLRA
jgi:monoamine oxidase